MTQTAPLHIRDAQLADAPAIAKVRRQAWLETYPSEANGISRHFIEKRVDRQSESEWIAEWEEIIGRLPGAHIWVALRNGRIVGFCDARKGSDHNEVDAIYLLAAEQGQGSGHELLRLALDWLGRDKAIKVQVVSYNHRAIKFYQEHSFVISAPVTDNEGLPVIFMTRPAGKN